MRKNSLLFFLLALSFISKAQTDNLKIGYQEFPVSVTGHAADNAGYMYYSGTFKGELKVNGQVLQTGQGLEDIFFVKTNAAGKPIYAKSFGSKTADYAVRDGLAYLPGNLYLAVQVTDAVNFESFSVTPYSSTVTKFSTSSIINFDTSGHVKWIKKTSITLAKLYAADNIIHAIGIISSGPVLFGDKVLYDSAASGSMVHLMIDMSGNLLNYKVVTPQMPGQYVEVPLHMASYRDGKLSVLLRVTGSSSFRFGDKTIPLPNDINNYYVLIKTDTSYTAVSYKVLNPPRVNFYNNGIGLPMTLSKQDSIYMVLSSDNAPVSIAYDGLKIPVYGKNILVVFDSSLRATRVAELGNPFAAGSVTSARKLFFTNVALLKDNLFFTGSYTGFNESPIKQIPANDTNITILPNLNTVININGPSKSFVAKTSFDFTKGVVTWIGDHSEYEEPNLYPVFLHTANDSLLVSSWRADNVWNPRITDINTHVVSGAMMPNADMPDAITYVAYLPDASRILIGIAKGRTALDPPGAGIKSNQRRTDAFIARIASTGEVKWYKRFRSSLLIAAPLKLMIRDNTAYFLIRYTLPVNEQNNIQVDEKIYDLKTSASLLARVDTSGNITAINLENNNIKDAVIIDFNFCKNGDIALLAGIMSTVSYGSFPPSAGSYLFRVDPATSKVITGRKLEGTPFRFQPAHIEIDSNDILYVSVPLNSAGTSQDRYATISLHNGYSFTDAITIENNVIGENEGGLGILKMDWNHFIWYKRTAGLNLFGIAGGYPPVFSINNKIIFMGHPSVPYAGSPSGSAFYWDKIKIMPVMDPAKTYLFRMDSAGKIELQKSIDGFYISSAKKKENGSLYISGYAIRATGIDTLSIGNDGGSDAVSLVMDTAFTAIKSFRLASPYHEYMEDMDIWKDSLVTFAYSAQTSPTLKSGRISVLATDYDADAFLSSRTIAAPLAVPLKLLSFTGERRDNTVDLGWTVMSNERARQYAVQRSVNGLIFETVETKIPITNTSLASYKTTDTLKDYGTYYYRLQLTATDGTISYSGVIPIIYPSKESSFYYDIHSRHLHIVRANTKAYEWRIVDAGGRPVLAGQKETGSKWIDLSNKPKGIYIIQTVDENSIRQTFRFIQ